MLEMGEIFFAELEAFEVAGTHLVTVPADPIAKALARRSRREGDRTEADETCAALP